MNHGSLFSGIGGFDLAARWIGWENSFHSDIDPFCLTILKHHFPNATSYTDIRGTDFTPWRGKIDVLSGGFPCQPFSQAGKRQGTSDDRHLWPEMLRAIREIRPNWVVGENVLGITNWNGGMVFEQVCSDLETEGYSVQPFVLPACGVNAPHQRYRTWFVAHRNDHELISGLQFDEQIWETLTAYGGADAGNSDRDGACAKRGATERADSESGGICGNGGRGIVADSDVYGHERRAESGWENDNTAEERSENNLDASRSGVQRTSADTDGIRPENLPSAGNGENDNTGKRGNFYSRATHDGPEWTSTNTHSIGSEQRCENFQPEETNGERPECKGGQRTAADTDLGGLERSGSEGRNGQYVERQDCDHGKRVSVPDPHGQMPQCGDDEREEGRDFEGFGVESLGGAFGWQEFPTFSPVCGGNDGISELLHGITFPRWRKESIKAYGNAIVPQVAYRIFRVINYMTTGK